MWQKRADTDAPLQKTFRDPTEKKKPVVTEKKNSKQTHCPKEPVVFQRIFYRATQNDLKHLESFDRFFLTH